MNRTTPSGEESPASARAAGSLRRVLRGIIPATLAVQVCSLASAISAAAVLGATTDTDAYYFALSIPLVVYGILLGGFRSGAIPELAERLNAGRESFTQATSELIWAVILVSTILACAGAGIALLLLPQLAGDVSPDFVARARAMLISLAPLGVLGALTGALGAVLTIRGRPVAPVAVLALDPLLRTVFVVVLGGALGTSALIAGNLVGGGLAVLVLAVLVHRREGVRLRWLAPARSSFLLRVFAVSLPLMVAQGFAQMSPLASRTLAAALGAGSVTTFELGLRLFSVPITLLGSVLIAPLTAAWSARYQESGWPAVTASFTNAVRGIVVVIPPVVVLSVVLRDELAALVFGGGAYPDKAVDQTASVLAMLVIGLPAHLLVVALAALFIVRKDAVTPMLIAMANVALTVAVALALRPSLGLAGIALATSITFIILCGVYALVASRRFGGLQLSSLRGSVLRAVVSGGLTLLVSWMVIGLLPAADQRLGYILTIAVTGGAGGATHLLVLGLGGEPEVRRALARAWRAFSSHGGGPTAPRPS